MRPSDEQVAELEAGRARDEAKLARPRALLRLLTDRLRQQNAEYDCAPFKLPVKLLSTELVSLRRTFTAEHLSVIATVRCVDARRYRLTLDEATYQGTAWEPPEYQIDLKQEPLP